MTQTVTIRIPDTLYEPIRRAAEATKQSVEAVLLTALQTSLPSLEGLSADMRANLEGLETADTDALWQVMLETVPPEKQQALEALLEKQQSQELKPDERQQLQALQLTADLVMLRKGWAAILLRFRGSRLPTLAELRQLSLAA